MSYDCGFMLSPESKYPYCRQCRLRDWRLKRRTLRKEATRDTEEEGRDGKVLSIKIPALKNRPSSSQIKVCSLTCY